MRFNPAHYASWKENNNAFPIVVLLWLTRTCSCLFKYRAVVAEAAGAAVEEVAELMEISFDASKISPKWLTQL
jgi:hypothetical protein